MSRTQPYDPAVHHEPLFELAPDDRGGSAMGEHSRNPEKAATTLHCPRHRGERKTGLFRQGEHLVWRIHDIVTMSGARIQCSASGAPLCDTGHNTIASDVARSDRCTHPPRDAAAP